MRIDDKGGPGLQTGWKLCKKCQGLFFAKNPDLGACPAGDKHFFDPQGETLGLRMNGQAGNGFHSGWRWCRKCQGLFCAAFEMGVCPAGGTHDATQSGLYFMRLENDGKPDHVDFDWPSIVLDGVAVGGSSHLTINGDGTCTLSVRFHDSGALEYNTHLAWVVKDCWNVLYRDGFIHEGSVHGTFEAGSRDDAAPPVEFHYNPIRDNWTDLAVGASAEGFASVKMDGWNVVNNALALGLGIAGIVLAVVALGAPAAAAGGAAVAVKGAGMMKK
jgi:hypothetical protein